MIVIYNFADYKEYINARIHRLKNKGRGTYSRIAEFLEVSNVLVSQVLNGDRNFSRDKAFLLTLFFKMTEAETDYFMNLFEKNVTPDQSHKQYLQARLSKIKKEIMEAEFDIKKSVPDDFQKTYYSSWLYSAVRLSLMKDDISTIEDLSKFLGYPEDTLNPILEDLISAQLIRRLDDHSYKVTSRSLHLAFPSEHLKNHHMNLKNLEVNRIISGIQEGEVCYSSMVVTSRQVIEEQIAKLRECIKESSREFSRGQSEELILFNLSLLHLSGNIQSAATS